MPLTTGSWWVHAFPKELSWNKGGNCSRLNFNLVCKFHFPSCEMSACPMTVFVLLFLNWRFFCCCCCLDYIHTDRQKKELMKELFEKKKWHEIIHFLFIYFFFLPFLFFSFLSTGFMGWLIRFFSFDMTA